MSASATPFATKNGFLSSEVSISQPAANQAKAVIVRSQPQLLTKLFYTVPANGAIPAGNVQIGATAVAQVYTLSKPCILALTGQISFQGSPNINAPNCGMASNDTAKDAVNFTGGGMSINVGSLSASGGCTGSATFCGKTLTYQPPATNPYAVLDSATLPTLVNCTGSGLTAYTTTATVGPPPTAPCKNDNVNLTGNTTITLNGGVYFISGTLTLRGTTAITGTALFILLPGANFNMKGTGTITLAANSASSITANATTWLPTVLQPYASLLSTLTLYDQNGLGNSSPPAVTLGGNSQITFDGGMYLPHAAVTFQGNPTLNATSCGNQLIAYSIAFNGNPTVNFDFQNGGCPAGTTSVSQYVALVQ
jgi:hypothetical protein